MKKFLSALICAIIVIVSAFGLTACRGERQSISIYMPDGAPALAMSVLMSENNAKLFDKDVDYKVVESSAISAYVTGENPQADICVLPVNLASKLLGKGETYKMLGTVTHGNLYILKKQGGEDITLENLDSLKGKTVGVIQLANVPGLTFKTILNDNGLEYAETGNDDSVDENKVNLKAVAPEYVLPSDSTCEYYVVPEPAASTKVNATKGALSFAGSLQTLYGGENGYPQAVIVAKNTVIDSSPEFIKDFTQYIETPLNGVLEKLQSDEISAEDVVKAITNHLTEGLSPTFNAANLTQDVIKNCAVKFVKSSRCKDEVNAFLNKLIAVNPTAASVVSDSFYYNY